MEKEKVSVIIPTRNRFKCLLNAIESVKNQTYENIEIIVINNCSIQKDYYTFDFKNTFGENVYIINIPKKLSGENLRNIGMMIASGEYIAFLDDDNYYLPKKIEKQILHMNNNDCLISCTEAFEGLDSYKPNISYNKMHYEGVHWKAIKNKFKNNLKLLYDMYENDINIWDHESIRIHNCVIRSSVIIKKDLIKMVGYFPLNVRSGDWEYWKKIIKNTKCVYLREPLTYYTSKHND